MTEQEMREWLDLGLKFHGHLCGGLPLGFRVGVAALEKLGVAREPDYDLAALVETGENHFAGCWADGIMLATGCTYGKGLIYKLFWGKFALTLIDKRTSRAIRVSVRPEVLEAALKAPFLNQRRAGVPPSKIAEEIARPMFERLITIPDDELLVLGEPFEFAWQPPAGTFDVMRCESCGELTVVRHMRVGPGGQRVCVGCAQSPFDYPRELALTRGPEFCQWPTPPKR